MEAINLNIVNQDIKFTLLTLSLLHIGLIYAFYRRQAVRLIYSLFSYRHANEYLRESSNLHIMHNIIFTSLMILNISFFLWTMTANRAFNSNSFSEVIFFVLTYYFIKYLINWFLGVFFNLKQTLLLSTLFSALFDKAYALISFPFLVVMSFFVIDLHEEITYILLFLFSVIFLLKVFWILRVGIKSFRFSKFYLFLYICNLELFPVLLLYKGVVFE